MQTLLRGWLVWDMTHSELQLGIVTSAVGIPMLIFIPIGGVIADRVDKQTLIVITEIINGICVFLMTALLYLNIIQIWHIIVITFLSGAAMALNMPSRQGIISELLDKDHLLNGVAMYAMGSSTMRIIGPMVGGILINIIGITGSFLISALLFIPVVYSMFMIGRQGTNRRDTNTGFFADFAEGLKYVSNHKTLLLIIIFGYVVAIIGAPYASLLPAFAGTTLHLDASGLGFLTGAAAVGALIGAISIASLGDYKKKGLLMILSGLIFGIFLMLFGNSTLFYLSLIILVVTGAANNICNMLNQTIIQSNADHAVLGRVLSLFQLSMGLQGLGAIPIGAIAQSAGAPFAVIICGLILAAFSLAMCFLAPAMRKV
jgi:MFS transporter, DHA1 family, staphyloferrin A biosynthesis exporter